MKKTFQKAAAFGLAVASLFTFAACDSKETVQIDAAKVVDTLIEQVKFETELELAKDSSVELLFDLPEGVSVQLYSGNGACADELAVFDCGNAENVSAVKDAVDNHLAELRDSFVDYIPEEAAKIDEAIVESEGTCVVLCVTDDDAAEAAVKAALE